jgi:HSP20 family molecular chaperone IbpA
MEDWLRAESEVLCTVPVGFLRSNEVLTVDAAVPGFSADDLEVRIEPLRLIISGKTEASEKTRIEPGAGRKRRALEIFHAVDLPVEVDPSKMFSIFYSGASSFSFLLNNAIPDRL